MGRGQSGVTGVSAMAALGLLLLAPMSADAAYPGKNGHIGFENRGSLFWVNPDGSGTKVLRKQKPYNPNGTTISEIYGWTYSEPAFSPSGTQLVFDVDVLYKDLPPVLEQRIQIANADGSGSPSTTVAWDSAWPVTCVDGELGGVISRYDDPYFSPNGKSIVFSETVTGRDCPYEGYPKTLPLDTPNDHNSSSCPPQYSNISNSYCRLVAPDNGFSVFDYEKYYLGPGPDDVGGVRTVKVANSPGVPVQLGKDVEAAQTIEDPEYIAGTQKFILGSSAIPFWGTPSTSTLAFSNSFTLSFLGRTPSASPDGKRAAYVLNSNGQSDIYVSNLGGGGLEALTDNAAEDIDPVFSPDGKKIAFASNRDGDFDLYTVKADGSGPAVRVTNLAGDELTPDWQVSTEPLKPPDTKITSDPGALTNDTTPQFTFHSTKPNSTFSCALKADSDPSPGPIPVLNFKPCKSPKVYNDPALENNEGYTFYVRAQDDEGLYDSSAAKHKFTLDTVPPDTLITESPLGTVGGQQNLVFKQQAVGPVGTIVGASPFVCKLGIQGKALKQVNAFPKKCNSTLNLKPDDGLYDKSGTYVYTAAARDAAGNVDQTPAESLPFIVDADGPDVKIIPPSPEKVTSDQTPSLYFEGPEDAVGFQCRFIFGNDKPGPDDKFKDCTSGKPSKKLKEGSWRFEVIALDAFGNVGKKASRVFKIDKKGPPKTEITSGPEGVVTELSPFTFKANRKDAEFDCALQPEGSQGKLKYSECSSPKSYPSQPDGEYTLYVRGFVPGAKGKDDAVFEKPPATRTFTVDTTPPTVEITSGPDFAGNPGQPTASFTYSASESARFTCSVGLAAAVVVSEADCNDPAGFTSGPLASGDYIFRVIARDTAGLHGSAARTFSIDTSPETTITSRPAESSSDHGPAWTFVSSTPGSTFSCRLSKQGDTLGGFFPCSSPFRASLAVGNRTFEVFATDPHGVSDPSPATDGFFITEQLLWGNYGNGSGTTIGRANLDGTGVDHNFITGASGPCSVAMDENHIYWTNQSSDSIGRAKLDGTGVNQNFITTGDQPCGIAVNGSHVYWSEYGNDSVNRRPVDGSGSNQMIIQSFGAPDPDFIALDSNFLYFSHDGNAVHPGLIGRANLDGTGLNTGFIDPNGGGGDPDPPTNPTGVAVNSTHIFIANTDPQAIQRATIAGTGNMNIVNGSVEACGVAVSSNHVFWANKGGAANSIGRANLDGSSPNQSFISGANEPCGVAVG